MISNKYNLTLFPLALFGLGILPLQADDYPLKRLKGLTYVVDYEPFWSPNSHEIVLISSRHGGMKVHVMDVASATDPKTMMPPIEMRQLTTGPAEDDSPAWSPDGKRIAFVSIRDGVSQICVTNADSTDQRQLTSGTAENIHPMSSPDNGRILFNTTHFAGATAADGRDVPSANKVVGEKIGWPAWSPDGKRIVFCRRVKEAFQIFVMNRDGSGVRQLTDAQGEFTNPRWSPDGSQILCSQRLEYHAGSLSRAKVRPVQFSARERFFLARVTLEPLIVWRAQS